MKGRIRIIFDGNNTSYRANAVTELYTKQGVRTSAIVGTLNIIHSTMEFINKSYNNCIAECIVVYDGGHSTRRTSLFPEYKISRKEKTEEQKEWFSEFYPQLEVLNTGLPLFGVKTLRIKGWEGDDLIYGLSEELIKQHPEDIVIIVSTDEDFHQLIGKSVHLYSPIKQILYTLDNYEELMGIPQELFLTYKIIKGDSSDGIPGIPGIGEKTGKTLVNTYGNLEQVLSSKADLIKSSRTKKIFTTEGLQTLDRNNQLINLKDYVDLTEVKDEIQEILEEEPFVDTKKSKEFLMKYQLTSILVKYKNWIEAFEEAAENFFN